MNSSSPSTPRLLCLLLALAMPPVLFFSQRTLESRRQTLGVAPPVELQNAPPLIAFVTAAGGGFRGVLANALWIRAARLQEQERFFELYTLSDWITKLQPEFSQVWAMQAWNMGWNISVKFSDPPDRWLWVRSAMELLRDEGLRYNPRDPLLHRELAWIFQDKMGKYTDLAHRHYKEQWIREMHTLLGPDADPAHLLQPATDDARRRAAILREKYKLDPERMRQVDQHYGPLDWRLPESHAIYWADLGLHRSRAGDFDLLALRRVIWQTMQGTFQRGRLVLRPGRPADFGPNLDMIPNVNRTYEEMKAALPDKRDVITRAHANFLKDAIYQLYTHSRSRQAAAWFDYTRTNLANVIPLGLGLDEFVVSEFTRDVADANPSRIRAMLEGLVDRQWRARLVGDDDEANGHALLARQIWTYYNARRAGQENVRMPSLAEIENDVRARLSPPAPPVPAPNDKPDSPTPAAPPNPTTNSP